MTQGIREMQKHQLMIALIMLQSSSLSMAANLNTPVAKPGTTVYQYTAETAAPAYKQGMVLAGGLNWNCIGSRCSISGPWPTPAVTSCKALATVVGALRSYGHNQGAHLDASQLAQCNAGLAVAASKAIALSAPALVSVAPKVSPPPASPAKGLQPTVTIKDFTPQAQPAAGVETAKAQAKPEYKIDAQPGSVTLGDGQYGARPPSPTVIAKPSGFAQIPGTPSAPQAGTNTQPPVTLLPTPGGGFAGKKAVGTTPTDPAATGLTPAFVSSSANVSKVATTPPPASPPKGLQPAVTDKDFAPALPASGADIGKTQMSAQSRLTLKPAEVAFDDGQIGTQPATDSAKNPSSKTKLIAPPSTTVIGKPSGISPTPTTSFTRPVESKKGLEAVTTAPAPSGGFADKSFSATTPSASSAHRGVVVITTDTLRYTGRGAVVITTDTLRYTGRGAVVINTRPLTYRGINR